MEVGDKRRVGVRVSFHITQQEILEVRIAFERDARTFPHRAMCAIAPDEIPDSNSFPPTVVVPQSTIDTRRVRRELDELDTALDRHALGGEMLAEEPLGFRL